MTASLLAVLTVGNLGCPSDDPGSCSGDQCGDSGSADTRDMPARDVPTGDPSGEDAAIPDSEDTAGPDYPSEITECTANEVLGCASATERLICNESGTGTVGEPCPGGEYCSGGECSDQSCEPGTSRCVTTQTVEVCAEDGSGYNAPTACPPGTACDENQCTDLCSISEKVATYIGCEYWAADLDNDGRGDGIDPTSAAAAQQYAVVISNPNADVDAQITVHNGAGTQITLSNPSVPALGLRSFKLPRQDVDGSGTSTNSYHIESTVPVTAHQFNPENNVYVYSNDASLLLPTHALGKQYIVMGWPARYIEYTAYSIIALRAYATIIAVEEGTTTITVHTPVAINSRGGFTGMAANETRNFTLEQNGVLNLETGNIDLLDITGMEISATQEIAVFFGHECSNVPIDTDYCDHMEEQLFPVETWSEVYVAAKSRPRGTEPDFWRILASVDETLIRTNPAQPGAHEVTLDRGEFVEFRSSQSFDIVATAPILVGQYLVGSQYGPGAIPARSECNTSAIGDPAFILDVPTAQYRTNYIVMTPSNYVEDFVSIVAPVGATVLLDSVEVPQSCFTTVGWGAYGVCHQAVADGAHILTADQAFGLFAYGYDCDVSYAYPGGLNLESLIEDGN